MRASSVLARVLAALLALAVLLSGQLVLSGCQARTLTETGDRKLAHTLSSATASAGVLDDSELRFSPVNAIEVLAW